MAKPWWRDAAIYHIYPWSFRDTNGDGLGDVAGITERLDHLAWLGVDALWMGPVFRSPQVDNGYDISDYRDIDPMLGTLADLDQLIREAASPGYPGASGPGTQPLQHRAPVVRRIPTRLGWPTSR